MPNNNTESKQRVIEAVQALGAFLEVVQMRSATVRGAIHPQPGNAWERPWNRAVAAIQRAMRASVPVGGSLKDLKDSRLAHALSLLCFPVFDDDEAGAGATLWDISPAEFSELKKVTRAMARAAGVDLQRATRRKRGWWIGSALKEFADNPDTTKAEVAAKVGISPAQLSRDPEFLKRLESLKQTMARQPRRGVVDIDDDGRPEAVPVYHPPND